MNTLRVASALVLGVLAFSLSGAATADRGHWNGHGHGHGHVGVGIVVDPFWFGAPYPGPYYPYYYPPYYYPPVVTAPAAPSIYIERDTGPTLQTSAYWYYCAKPPGYYPHVKQCPGGWQPVAPQPPPDEEQ